MTMGGGPRDVAFDAGQRKVLEQIASGAALADVLEQIVWLVERQAEGMSCSILLVDAERGCVRHGAAPNLPVEFSRAIDGAAIGPDAGSCGAAAYRGERVIVEDIATHPNWSAYRHLALPHGLRACWSSPIFSAGREVLGTFAMYYRKPRGPMPEELSWVDAATHLAAIAIRHEAAARALRESEARHRETAEREQRIARLYAVSSSVNVAIVRVRDPHELYAQACRIAVEQGRLRLAWVGLHDRERRTIVPVARHGTDDGYIDRITLGLDDKLTGWGPAARALSTGTTAVFDDIASSTDFYWKAEALARGLRSCAGFALKSAGRPIGVLLLYADRPGFFAAEELRVLESLAEDISFAVESAGTEVERRRLVDALGERVKELTLLHRMASLLQADRPCDEAFLAELVAPIPRGWRHPDVCVARIACGELEARTPGWRETPWKQSVMFTAGGLDGVIEVAYLAERPRAAEGPFLAEERTLLQSLADMVSAHVERHRTQAQLRQSQRLQSLGTLAGGIAHDFNNVLTAIGAHAELGVNRLPADHAVRRHLDGIRQATTRAADLVRRILTFSRQSESRRAVVALPAVIDEVLKLLRATLPRKIDIQARFAAAPCVLADATQIHQVVMNLGTNAAHAMAESGGVLDVQLATVTIGPEPATLSADLRDGDYVRLSVADTGSGMSPATLEHIFEPFFTTKGPGQGTGLGLSVVHGIMKSHEGAITVESEVGRGTTFHLYFPVANPAAEDPSPPATAEARGQGEHVLYVDGEGAVVDVAIRTLEGLGFRVTGSTSAREALGRFRSEPRAFDVVVTDLAMPELPGLDLVRQIREIRPEAALVVTSGYVRPGATDTVRELEGVEVVLKPDIAANLGPAIRRALDRSRSV